jgi:hypothetical protein
MKLFFSSLFLVLIILFLNDTIQANTIRYLSPLPGSVYNSEYTNIIIGYSEKLNPKNINSFDLKIIGSVSGIHSGKIIILEKDTKIIFVPDNPFETGEKVTVNFKKENCLFFFYISKEKILQREYYDVLNFSTSNSNNGLSNSDSVPNLTITINGPTASGYIFITNNLNAGTAPSCLMILNNNGTPIFARDIFRRSYDFNKQNENLITYYDEVKHKYYGLNRSYQIVDSFWCKNGYSTDFHELRVLPDGSSWLLSVDPQWVNMSLIVPGGNTNALVKGLVIQKIDADKNVVFQWRSWDHFQITDATHENLLDDTIDYVHGNSIEVDNDNNIILSSRNMDEITKINTSSGSIMWRLGGKNNQFTFLNDTMKFSHQHDARRISNGNITIFDNGNYHTPARSRAIEYAINETSKTVNLVWQYKRTPAVFAFAMGNVQRLSNGNTLIGWGSALISLTEVTSAGSIMYELSLPATMSSYRAFRYEWLPTEIEPVKNAVPGEFKLYQNYPNPFNPSTNIKYQIANSSLVSLKIYNILGKEVATLVNEFQQAGIYEKQFSINELPGGIYFYKLTVINPLGLTEEFTNVKKMILVK